MIIIPTEKRLDWRRPPVMILCLLALNVLVFTLFQADDERKFQRAYDLYEQYEFAQFEAPAYLAYRKQNGILQSNPQLYEELNTLFERSPDELSQTILLDVRFPEYLERNSNTWIPPKQLSDWVQLRPEIDRNIAGISSIQLGLTPQRASLITVFSHQFLHGGWMHLLGNMVFLLICGFAVEAALGPLRLLGFYLLSGVSGGLLFSLIETWSGRGDLPLVGASGAISGIMAMYLMLFRLQKIEFFYWLTVFIGYFRAPALVILPIYLGKELALYLSEEGSNVAYMAHCGGFLAGAALIALLHWRKPETIDQEYIENDQAIDPRRESLSKVLSSIEDAHFPGALKLLDAHQENYGQCTHSQFIRINLLSTVEPSQWQAACNELLQKPGRDPELIQSQHTVWQRLESKQQGALKAQHRAQLAIRFLDSERPESAEAIAIKLCKEKSTEPMLAKLLGQLAQYYARCDNPHKQQQYEQALDVQLKQSL